MKALWQKHLNENNGFIVKKHFNKYMYSPKGENNIMI